MDIKKDWDKIVKAVLFIFGAVFFLLALINLPETIYAKITNGVPEMSGPFTPKLAVSIGMFSLYLAGLIFFVGMAVIQVLSLLGKKDLNKFIYLGVGIIGTIAALLFLFTGVSVGVDGLKAVNDNGLTMLFDREAWSVAPYVLMVLVFGLLPLIKGLKKVLCKESAAASAKK